jgi:hypothetical protein
MKIKELWSDESKWGRGRIARDSKDKSVRASDPEACCWCLMGAVHRCYEPENREEIFRRLREFIRETYQLGLVQFNDSPYTNFEKMKEVVETLDV